jgi:glutamine amidotransferase
MMKDVAIIDYGIGNLFSVRRAFEHCGASVLVTNKPDLLLTSPRLVLPGVGAFADGMRGLKDSGLDELIYEFANSGKPLLGICLGMQMLATISEEFGVHEGLGIIPGRVIKIPDTTIDNKPHKIPHIGWEQLLMPENVKTWDETILHGLSAGDAVYLVHSYFMLPDDDTYRLADCNYNGRLISAVVRRENVYGAQFHPEKSGEVGLTIINNFLTV